MTKTVQGMKAPSKAGVTLTKVGPRPPVNAKKSGGASARKIARKTATAEEVADLDVTRLPMRQQLFVSEFVECGNGTQAAIRAGYAASDAASRASKLLANPSIRAIVQARVDDKIEAVRATREHVLQAFADIVEADATELTAYHRYCCPYCHGAVDKVAGGRKRQFKPSEWSERVEKHEARRQELIAANRGDIGEFSVAPPKVWYDKRLDINEDCPECFGIGVGEVVLKDTRYISRRARALLAGIKETKDGIEFKTNSKEAALAVLARHHRLYDEGGTTVNVNIDAAELDARFGEGMRRAQERMAVMRAERLAAREARSDDLQAGYSVRATPAREVLA